MKRLILATMASLAFMICTSAKEQFIYTCISQDEGLTSKVSSIYKEKDGDVWMGSPNALYQFNGHILRHREDPVLAGRTILQVNGDGKDNLWVLTDNWIFRYDEEEDTFEKMHVPEIKERTLFYSLCTDDKGVWFGSYSQLFRYTYADERFFLFCETTGHEAFDMKNIRNFDSNTLLCSSHNGLIFIDKDTGEVSDAPYGSRDEASAILIDSKGRIWTATYNNGIEVYGKDGNLIRKYDTATSGLSNDIVLCMTEKDGRIWAGTDGGGINIICLEEDSIEILSHVSGDGSSFPANSIMSIYTDHDGNIWAGSVRNGLIRISSSGITTYSDSYIGTDTGLSNPTVTCLYQDQDPEKIWIGTDGEGLNMLDIRTGKFTHFKSTLNKKVTSIAAYSEEELALSIFADRIILFNKRTGRTRDLKINDPDVNYQIRYSGRTMNLAEDKDGSLLLISNRMRRFDKKTGKCFLIEVSDGSGIEGNILPIGRIGQGIWMHDNSRLYLLEGDNLTPKGDRGKSGIKSGDIDSAGTIWLGTSEGLERFDPKKGTFLQISTTLFDTVNTVICDKDSRIWIGTEKALFAYNLDSGIFSLFGESDGVKPNEFLSKPRMLSGNGDIFMGGVKGLVHITSGFSTETAEIPEIKLYDITADNIAIKADKEGYIKVPRDCKNLRISITAQEKDIFRNRMYRFSFGDRVVYETDRPVLELKQMPTSGHYEVLVSCTQRDGSWTEPENILTCRIPQPWYLSWWFIMTAVLLLALSAGRIIMTEIHKKENQLRMALKEQEQRLYEEKVALLINMSHELRTPLTLIMAPLKRILKHMGPEDEEYTALNRIYRQSRRMKDLLNMALDLRKMEVGKSSMKMESHDFNSWLTEATEDTITEGHAEGIIIVRQLDPALAAVDFDKVKCETVMLNILMNAIKHSSRGDTITIRSILTEDGMARVSVSDQGPGLGDTDPSRMFTCFYQSNSEQYGSGIGLSYSKILTELHGGHIGAYDNEDKGATFWWEIPVISSVEISEIPSKAYLNEIMGHDPIDSPAQDGDSFSTAGMTLMLVDDSQDLLDFLREALCAEFSEIITATSGNQALAALSEGNVPDIIISDVNMPDGDGYALCKAIRENVRYSHIPVVLLTARGEEQSQSDSYRIGAEAYMAKPFEVETLMEMIRSILRRKAEIRKKYLDTNEEEVSRFTSKDEDFILRLNRLIENHISDPALDQQLICRELGVSRALLYNRMKSITGAGTKEYITRIRLEKAKSLIESTDLTIAEISEITGFSTQSYFSTAFKGYTGKTPSQYKASRKS